MSIGTLPRRQFLQNAAGIAVLPALHGLDAMSLRGRGPARPGHGGYGPLVPARDLRDGVERIALPRGFHYRSFSHAGETMDDGNVVPLAHDGMAVFNMRDGRFRLVRNHEDRNAPGAGTTAIDGNAYDALGGGGTTTLIVDPRTRELERHFVSLSGTTVNCAGGRTPWESWISCEETNAGPSSGWMLQHGYCFEVPAQADGTVPALPLPDMGRFSHEAIAIDPRTGFVYETEDNGNSSGFYRFLPNTQGRLIDGGRLEMLAVQGRPGYDTQTGQQVGAWLPVTWVPVADPNPADPSSTAVFDQGRALGAASFARLEGCWYGDGSIYFAATSGGDAGAGQVWQFLPYRNGGYLTLIFESPNADVLDAPDNLTVSPRGGLLLCEDGGDEQYLRGLTPEGRIFDFAVNLQTGHEWAGATFGARERGHRPWPHAGRWTPEMFWSSWQHGRHATHQSDDVTLFVNRQGSTSGTTPPESGNEGMTFAIWGPWERGAL